MENPAHNYVASDIMKSSRVDNLDLAFLTTEATAKCT